MRNLPRYDTLIVGAGPAGALIAYDLAKNGLKVLLIEKKPLPRYKSCGGGITGRALDLFPFDISPVIEDYTYTARMMYQNRLLYEKTYDKPIIGMVMRDAFDYYLIEQAIKQGAVVQDNTAFNSVAGKKGDLLINTSNGSFKAAVIAGADGVNSRVAQALGLKIKRNLMTAIEGEVYSENSTNFNGFKKSVNFDFGVIPSGYGWVFPKRDHISAGVVTTSKRLRNWQKYFRDYLELKKINPASKIYPLKGHLIPFNPDSKNSLADCHGLVAGDAAGFTDPLTGEGIYYAVRQAGIASQVIKSAIVSGPEYLVQYTDLIRKAFMPDLICAQRLSYVLYRYPAISKKILFRLGEILGENMVGVITGGQSYKRVFRKITVLLLNPIKLLSLFRQH
jgi:geranylgeranyl reductase family protein